jgi:hypothetical protein
MAKTIYIYYNKETEKEKGKGIVISCTNKKILSERTGLGYDNIVRVFTREKKIYWEGLEWVIIKIYVDEIIKGKQKFSKRMKFEHGY